MQLAEETEGWVIALQMVGQSLERGSGRSLQDVLADGSGPKGILAMRGGGGADDYRVYAFVVQQRLR